MATDFVKRQKQQAAQNIREARDNLDGIHRKDKTIADHVVILALGIIEEYLSHRSEQDE